MRGNLYTNFYILIGYGVASIILCLLFYTLYSICGKTFTIRCGFLFLSFMILFYSLSTPTEVATKADMASVEFGYPIRFLSQDLSSKDPPSFPRMQGSGSLHDDPVTMYWGALLINIVILMVSLEILLFIFYRLKKYFTHTRHAK